MSEFFTAPQLPVSAPLDLIICSEGQRERSPFPRASALRDILDDQMLINNFRIGLNNTQDRLRHVTEPKTTLTLGCFPSADAFIMLIDG